jgi:hypothetical protein
MNRTVIGPWLDALRFAMFANKHGRVTAVEIRRLLDEPPAEHPSKR